ncbi:MAG: fibronectin type III domain-containing protein, partial [Clostridia bacterium]|nr:fibronectin type III domain-containing protein [Clostridia bacterium]
GGMAYYSVSINGSGKKDLLPGDKTGGIGTSRSGVAQMGEFLIIEADEKGALRITGYDVMFGCKMYTRYVRCPADKRTFINNRTKKRTEPVPYFDVTSEVEMLSSTSDSVTVRFSQAKSDGYIESYCAVAYEGKKEVARGYCLADNFFFPIPEYLKIEITGLKSKTEYTIKIYAVNAYEVSSKEPLEISVKTK